MCHGAPVSAFPPPTYGELVEGDVNAYAYGDGEAARRIAVLPDIYGCTPFYRGLCRHLEKQGAYVALVDPFHMFGPLSENTREAAFERRHRVADGLFLDAFLRFTQARNITGVLGFCLGGYYVFELARRGMAASLIGLYGFPQGMPNRDPLPTPFDYLARVTTPFTMLMGENDASVGPENVARLEAMSASAPAMTLKTYTGVGHGFLPELDSDDPHRRDVACDALARIEAQLLGASDVERIRA